jgi:hypothetical protein
MQIAIFTRLVNEMRFVKSKIDNIFATKLNFADYGKSED